MKLTTPPEAPVSIRFDVVASAKYEEICRTLIELDRLSTANLPAVEVCASAYASWLDAESETKRAGYDSPSATHAHRYRTSYFVALNALGLGRTPKEKSAPRAKVKPTPIKLTDQPVDSAEPPKRPRLRIYGRA